MSSEHMMSMLSSVTCQFSVEFTWAYFCTLTYVRQVPQIPVSKPCAIVSTSDDAKGLHHVFPNVNQVGM